MKAPIITAMAVAAGLAFSFGAMAQTLPLSKQEYKDGLERIESEHRSDKKACKALSGNASDICMAEANGKKKVSKANLEARDKNTRKAHYGARVAGIEADYSVARERCDDRAGNNKDVCMKEAKSAKIAAKADAKAQMKSNKAYRNANDKSTEARQEAREKSADARHDAAVDKRDARYAVAKERCDALAGDVQAKCIDEAKARHGMK
jgi:hypothetical protein